MKTEMHGASPEIAKHFHFIMDVLLKKYTAPAEVYDMLKTLDIDIEKLDKTTFPPSAVAFFTRRRGWDLSAHVALVALYLHFLAHAFRDILEGHIKAAQTAGAEESAEWSMVQNMLRMLKGEKTVHELSWEDFIGPVCAAYFDPATPDQFYDLTASFVKHYVYMHLDEKQALHPNASSRFIVREGNFNSTYKARLKCSLTLLAAGVFICVNGGQHDQTPVSYTHLTLPTTPYV